MSITAFYDPSIRAVTGAGGRRGGAVEAGAEEGGARLWLS